MIIINFSQLTVLERAALDAAARRERPGDEAYTGEAHLEAHVSAMVAAATDSYVTEQLPGLRGLAEKYLNTDEATREQLVLMLDGGGASNSEPPAG